MKKRILYIDIAKAIAIFTVLMGHTVDSKELPKAVLYSFHMPLFFLLSGFTVRVKEAYTAESWKSYLLKKIRVLLFPYLLWGCIYASFSFKHLLQIMWGTRETLIGAESLTSLWFLPVLFLASVLTECANAAAGKWSKRYIPPLMAAVFFAGGLLIPHASQHGYPWGADIALTASGFMLSGQMLSKLYSRDAFQKPLPHVLICCASLGGMLAVFLIAKPEGYVLMANAVYGNRILFLLTSFMGSLFVLSVSRLLEPVCKNCKPLIYIGQNTLGIFILHKPVVELLRKVVTHVGFDYNHPLPMLLIPAVTLCVCVPGLYLMKMFVPFMFGEWDPERRKKNESSIAP